MPQVTVFHKKFRYIVGNFSSPIFGQKNVWASQKWGKRNLAPQVPKGCKEDEIQWNQPLLRINNLPQLLNSWNSVGDRIPTWETPGDFWRQVAIGHHVFDRRRSKELQGKPPGITFLEGLGRGGRPALQNGEYLEFFRGWKKLGDFFLVWMFYGVYF